MKEIIFSKHSETQMLLRGADKEEVTKTINDGLKETAKFNKFHSTLTFELNQILRLTINTMNLKH